MQYYIVYNGTKAGPMSKQQLMNYGLNAQSLVWYEGLSDWIPASQVPDLADVLGPAPAAPRFGAPQMAAAPVYKNYQTAAIVATVVSFLFSCFGLILGIIAIVKANGANKAYAAGAYTDYVSKNNTARGLIIGAYILAAIGLITSLAVLPELMDNIQRLEQLQGM